MNLKVQLVVAHTQPHHITPAGHDFATNEPITPSHALPANEPIIPLVHALATNEPITPLENNDHDMESDTLAKTFHASEEPEPPTTNKNVEKKTNEN